MVPFIPTGYAQNVVKQVVRTKEATRYLLLPEGFHPYGSGFQLEDGVYVCDNGSDSKAGRGLMQTITLNQSRPEPIQAELWSRTENVSGSPSGDYSLYIDLIHDDGTPLWGQTAVFDTGTHDWQKKTLTIQPAKPIKSLTIYALFRNKSGKVAFRDMKLSVLRTPDKACLFDSVPVIPVKKATLQIRDVAADSDFVELQGTPFGVIPTVKQEEQITQVTLVNSDNQDRCLTLVYTIEVLPEGLTWCEHPRANNAVLNEIKYDYNGNQRLARLFQSHDGAVDVATTPYLAYQYAGIADGFRVAGMTYPSGKTLTYDYDDQGHISAINEGTTSLVSYLHSGSGRVLQTTYNEPGLSLTHTNGGLDRFGRIVNHAWMKNGQPLVHIAHGYDYSGNRTCRNDLVHAANSELYAFDHVNQITSLNRGALSADKDAVTTLNFMESWDFDKTGNWTQYSKNGAVESRKHNTVNEIQDIASHDKSGNMTGMPGLNGKYDAWNRLVEVRDISANLIARYDYNGANQRIKKTVGNVVTTSFFNEKWQELESREPGTVSPRWTSYVWGTRHLDDLIYRQRGEEKLYSLADPNWNVVAITGTSGVVQERMRYDAFGKIMWMDTNFLPKANSAYGWNRTFTGQVIDSETGLMLYRWRHYHVGLGRFVQRDPIGYDGEELNLYRYVVNGPHRWSDPMGLFLWADCAKDKCEVGEIKYHFAIAFFARDPKNVSGMTRAIDNFSIASTLSMMLASPTAAATVAQAIAGASSAIATNGLAGGASNFLNSNCRERGWACLLYVVATTIECKDCCPKSFGQYWKTTVTPFGCQNTNNIRFIMHVHEPTTKQMQDCLQSAKEAFQKD